MSTGCVVPSLFLMEQIYRTYRSLCSGVNEGASLSRSSISMKSFPSPSYLANSMSSPIWAARGDDDETRREDEMAAAGVEKAFAARRRPKRPRAAAAFIFIMVVFLCGSPCATTFTEELYVNLDTNVTKADK